ncbi:MAG: DUF1800 family protein, partial [Bacteroidota bacterium]
WLDEQFALPRLNAFDVAEQMSASLNGEEDLLGMIEFRSAWWNLIMKNPDLLRQRINYILSQIFVVSAFGSDLFEDHSSLSSVYYDVLGSNAFGNYRNLLSGVSRNVSMGIYLSHMNNPKSDPANNIHPDENYAREVMQLFSIGLYELNNDGTRKTDGNGQLIPTYDNNDIREFAKIFTGFSNGLPNGQFGVPVGEGEALDDIVVVPMKMYDAWHEPGVKNLLNGQVVAAGQSGMQDFEAAMDNLYHHPNVGPFIGKALIQFLVSANPSPAYVDRVANTFNDNGEGQRGDLKAVIKAILLDPEARTCDALNQATSGKLREPILRYTGFLKAFNTQSNIDWLLHPMDDWGEEVGQIPVYATSVFNFYQPEFQPNGPVATQNLVAPVFQIHNSSSSIGFINEVNRWTFMDIPFGYLDWLSNNFPNLGNISILPNFTDEMALVADAPALIDRLDLLLACGQLSESSKAIIVDAVNQATTPEDKLDLALYLIMVAPDYAILK